MQRESLKSWLFTVLSEFCERSTFHGVGHLADRNRHWIERLWWIVAIGGSMIFCTLGFYAAYTQWINDPIGFAFNTVPIRISEIPFPAVTICPITLATKDKFNYTAVYRSLLKLESRNITADELKIMNWAVQYCDDNVADKVLPLLPDEYLADGVWSTINEIAPTFNETFSHCRLFNKIERCDKLFRPIITEAGLCYTFNSLSVADMITDEAAPDFWNLSEDQPLSNWIPDIGYKKPATNESYPHRTFGLGYEFSLLVVLQNSIKNIDALCGGGVQGFVVVFHPPMESAPVFKQYMYVTLGKTVSFTVEPKLTTIRNDVKNYSPEVRKCFLDSERQLRFYKHYTQYNCEQECLANFTLTECGCVRLTMPRTNDTKICGPAKIGCCRNVDGPFFNVHNSVACNCLPSCTLLSYSAYSSEATYKSEHAYFKYSSKFSRDFNFQDAAFSRITVSFREESFTPTTRFENFDLIDFLSCCGGIVGLFMGASLLSIVELLYYVTVRIFLTYRRDRNIRHDNRAALVPFEPQSERVRQRPNNPTIVFTFLP